MLWPKPEFPGPEMKNMPSLYDITVLDRRGNPVSLATFKGKVLLIVNTATGCGFTPQYKDLEELYEKYHERGFEILDFPCNQFKEQAPGSDEEIHTFCTLKYNTKFERFKKIAVNGPEAAPLFTFLKEQKPYVSPKGLKDKATMLMLEKLSGTGGTNDIRWNFSKFLVSKEGEVVARYEPVINAAAIEKDIAALLA